MIYVVGDVHGSFERFFWLKQHLTPEDTVIQVGDFGFYKSTLNTWNHMFPNGYPCRVLAIEGNHEDYRILNTFSRTEPTEIHKNLWYVPRGYTTMIDGKLFAFLGGANSIDKAWRLKGVDWFPEEVITDADVETLYKNVGDRQVDVLITHAAPDFTVTSHWPPLNRRTWMLEADWQDTSSTQVGRVNYKLLPTNHYCGHMHKSVFHGSVRIIDINEIVVI